MTEPALWPSTHSLLTRLFKLNQAERPLKYNYLWCFVSLDYLHYVTNHFGWIYDFTTNASNL